MLAQPTPTARKSAPPTPPPKLTKTPKETRNKISYRLKKLPDDVFLAYDKAKKYPGSEEFSALVREILAFKPKEGVPDSLRET
eukprot:8434862-Pyramimonas_sp.AAC.1